MSRLLYGSLALAALAIVLTDSDPALEPPAVRTPEEAGFLTEHPAPARETSSMVVTVDPVVEEVESLEEDLEPAPEPVHPLLCKVPDPPLPPPPPPAPPLPEGDEGLSSTWTTDSEQSALDPEVQAARIASDHDVEAVFVIDTTGSMGWIFETARTKALQLMKGLEASRDEGKTARAALVSYKDRRRTRRSDGVTGWDTTDSHLRRTALGNDWGALRSAFAELHASGGGDLEEDVQGGLLQALDELSWSRGPDTTRLVYLIGDAPAKRYEDQPGVKALAARLHREGFTVHAFNASSTAHRHHERVRDDWKLFADATGGSYEVIAPSRPGATARPVHAFRPEPVCRKPRRPTPPSGAPDLWIGPGDASPGSPLEGPEVLGGDLAADADFGSRDAPAGSAEPRPEDAPPRPRRFEGLGLEIW